VPFVRVWLYVIVGVVAQLSVAVVVAGDGMALHSTVMFAGMPARIGAVISWTVITWLPVEVLPQLSWAVHTRVRV
jgi:hypothetical protein